MEHFSEMAVPTIPDRNNWNFFKSYFEAVQKVSEIVCVRNAEIPHYRYKHLAVEHYFLALDIWRKCPLPRVLVDHFSKVYRWINVAKTYKFFSGASPPTPQFFSPQLCDETHQLNFEYLSLFTHSGKVLTDESHQLTVDLSMKLALRIFLCLRLLSSWVCKLFLLKLFSLIG